MRGTVLVVDPGQTGIVNVEELRAEGLIVHEVNDLRQALTLASDLGPDVVVAVFSSAEDLSCLGGLRTSLDYAVSILVVGLTESHRESARHLGADALVGPSSDLADEIHRALILRRSGRRLHGNGRFPPVNDSLLRRILATVIRRLRGIVDR